MHIYVVAVSGLVQVRQAEDQPWFVASTNMVLSEGAELRTGPHSSVTCVIPPGSNLHPRSPWHRPRRRCLPQRQQGQNRSAHEVWPHPL